MHEASVKLLNEALADELAAIHQYMYFHFHCDDQGYEPLSTLFKAKAIEEMQHAERLAERILFLKGEVEMKLAAEVVKTHDVAEMLDLAKKSEEAAIKMYNRFAVESGSNADSVDTQAEHLAKFGEQFLALQSMERSRSASAGPAEGA